MSAKNSTLNSQPIKIGRMALAMCHAPALLLDRSNLLKKAGLKNFELKYFTKGSLSAKALGAGETNMAFFGAIIPAIANGLPARIVAVNSMGGTQLVCNKDSKVKSLKDLAKTTVGTLGPTASPTSILTIALNKAGVLNQVKLRHINRRNIVTALIDKKIIDCTSSMEPLTSSMVQRGARIILNEKQIYNNGKYPFTFVVARQDYIKNHRDKVKQVLTAHIKAQTALNNDKKTTYPLLQKYFASNGISLSNKAFKKALDTNIFQAQISKKFMTRLINVMAESKIIPKGKNFSDFVDCSFGMCVD